MTFFRIDAQVLLCRFNGLTGFPWENRSMTEHQDMRDKTSKQTWALQTVTTTMQLVTLDQSSFTLVYHHLPWFNMNYLFTVRFYFCFVLYIFHILAVYLFISFTSYQCYWYFTSLVIFIPKLIFLNKRLLNRFLLLMLFHFSMFFIFFKCFIINPSIRGSHTVALVFIWP